MKRFLLLVIIGMAALPFVYAAEVADVQSAQDSLDYTLMNLRRSVDRLTGENRELAEANQRLRARLGPLQDELASLQGDEARVLEQFSALEPRFQKRMESVRTVELQVARRKEESLSVDLQIENVSRQIVDQERRDEEARIAVEQSEDEVRTLMMEPFADPGQESVQLTAERERLKDESRVSLLELQRAREEWLELQGVNQGGPDRVGTLKKERDELAAKVEAKTEASAQLADKVALAEHSLRELAPPQNLSPVMLAALEQEVRMLNERYRGLNDHRVGVQKGEGDKARKVNDAMQNEKQKLEAKVAEESERNRDLKIQLDRYRRQMVELDKRKAQLEKVVYGDK